MKNIFLVVLFLVLSFINIIPTHALDSSVEKIDAIYKIYHTNGSTSYSRNSSYKLYVDGKFTYCITPGILFVKGEGYYSQDSYELDQDKKRQMELISYYGYGYKNHTDIKYYLATQELIHNVLGYNITYNEGNFNVNNEKNEINELISKHNILPDMPDSMSIAKYTETLLIDNNHVLDEFIIEHSDNVRVEKKDNTLTVELLTGKSGEIKFYKGVDDKTKFFLKDNSQTVANFKLSKELMKTITVNREELGKIEVYDKHRATFEPIEGTTYNLLDSNYNILETKTTDFNGYLIFDGNYQYGNYYVQEINSLDYPVNEEILTVELESELSTLEVYHGTLGSITIKNIDKYGNKLNGKFEIISSNYKLNSFDNLNIGTYYVKQLEVDKGYIIDNNTYEINLTKDNLNQELVVINYQPTGSIKVEIEDEEGNKLEGKYEITDKAGNKIDTSKLDIGTYYVKQIETELGYIIDDTTYEVEIELDDLNKTLVIVNKKLKGSIKVEIEDEEGNKLEGKYEITDKSGNKVDTSKLDIGTYYVKQIETEPGYIIDDTTYEVEIELDDLNKTHVIVNKKIPETLPKTSSNNNYNFIISLIFILLGFVLRRIKYLEH